MVFSGFYIHTVYIYVYNYGCKAPRMCRLLHDFGTILEVDFEKICRVSGGWLFSGIVLSAPGSFAA